MHIRRNLLLILFSFVFTVFVSAIPDIIKPSYWKSLTGTDLIIGIVIAVLLCLVAIASMVFVVIKLREIDNTDQEIRKQDNEKRDQKLIEAFKQVMKDDKE